ncbi:MAG: histidine kinase dimerization/phosphoacceptor domain -containing protein [Balneolaceae bacterium]|nr:histidine kinase dimerization/phosphoacceptor domain -containing protein [Balneolaceae bacterium]
MEISSSESRRFYLSRKLIWAVGLFVVLASGMVVLVNFSLNMISASRNYTSLLSQWSQFHSQGTLYLERYARDGELEDLASYRQAKEYEERISGVIDELFLEDMDVEKVFDVFNEAELYPNEISTLIISFQYFGDLRPVQRLRESWNELDSLDRLEERLVTRLERADDPAGTNATQSRAFLSRLDEINEQWVWQSRQLTAEVAGISQGLRQFGLWFSVINGLLLLLVGVVISVRVSKSINRWEHSMAERDRLARIPEMNPNPVLVLSGEGEVSYCNSSAEELLPRIRKEGIDHAFLRHMADHLNHDRDMEFSRTRTVEVDGTWYQQLIHYVREEDAYHIHAQDVTDKRRQQHELRASLEEKEVLLGEIHHRVKNNLAVVSGLLEMESMMGRDPGTALQESRDRIKSMAIIHEILYRSNSFSNLNLKHYVEQLSDYIGDTYIRNGHGAIRLKKEVEDVTININQAIPAGLILSEMLGNAIEHGYDSGQEGEIRVQLRQEGDWVVLMVSDDGKGLPEHFDYESEDTVGFTIVRELSRQLEGEVALDSAPGEGVRFVLRFQKEAEARGAAGNYTPDAQDRGSEDAGSVPDGETSGGETAGSVSDGSVPDGSESAGNETAPNNDRRS